MSLTSPKYTKINETFVCAHCGHCVPPSSSTCRDHCSKCLWSMHLDTNPGDRAANCGGELEPIGYYTQRKKGYMIQYRCLKCGTERVNRFLEIDSNEPDNFDALLKIKIQG